MCVCVYLSCTSNTVVVYIQYVCPCLHDSACACACGCLPGCLGARGAGGALQGGLGEASGEGSDAGICQGGGREQLVPAADCGRQVQVLQEDLGHSHEALVVHTPVIPPHYYLEKRGGCNPKCNQWISICVSAGINMDPIPVGLCPEDSRQTTEPAGRWGPDSSSLLWFSSWPSTGHSPAHTPSRRSLQGKKHNTVKLRH